MLRHACQVCCHGAVVVQLLGFPRMRRGNSRKKFSKYFAFLSKRCVPVLALPERMSAGKGAGTVYFVKVESHDDLKTLITQYIIARYYEPFHLFIIVSKQSLSYS